MLLDKHEKGWSVRIPDMILAKLTADAESCGAGKPSVLLRMFIIQEIKKGSVDGFAKIKHFGKTASHHGGIARLTIRFNDDWYATIEEVIKTHFDGKFSVLVCGVLAQKYKQKPSATAKKTSHKPAASTKKPKTVLPASRKTTKIAAQKQTRKSKPGSNL